MDSIYLGPSFSDLPNDITVNFLLMLPIKTIFVCKIVCKTWHQIISEPSFAKLHFEQAQAFPLIQISGHLEWSRMIYLLQPEEDFEHKLDICDHSGYDSKCRCRVRFEPGTEFKLPWPDRQMMFHDKYFDYRYRAVNSCNGLLCLSNNEDIVVCNPVTGEFVNLPKAAQNGLHSHGFQCGFGFSPTSNQYKVVRVCARAQIHTLGTKIWKDIDSSGCKECWLDPTYLNGYLYWPNYTRPLRLIALDIENECFAFISEPPMKGYYLLQDSKVSLGVLGGELSISCCLSSGETLVLVRKNVGAAKVWSKVFSIRLDWEHQIRDFGPCQPIKYMNDGALLMVNFVRNCLIYWHPRRQRIRYFHLLGKHGGVRGQYNWLNVFAHIPSFVSLKDALSGHDVEVLESRVTAELKQEDEDSLGVKEIYEVKHN